MTRLLVVNSECTGCGAGEMACSMRNIGEFNPSRSSIQTISLEPDFFRLPVVCAQCHKPSCAEIRPAGAITRDEATGIVKVSREKCNSCRMCEEACPFGVIVFSQQERKAAKCELCEGNPRCAQFYVARALQFREPEVTTASKRRTLAERLKEDLPGRGRLSSG
jgi:Fe-S-cluster-containing hydrogenase component 2